MRTEFAYTRAASVSEAVDMARALGETANFLAGGTDIYLDWKNGRQLGTVVDISHLRELDYVTQESAFLRLGATTTLRTLERMPASDDIRRALATVSRVMCTPQTRALATVGGNLANASAAADLPPVLSALDASVHVVGPDREYNLSADEVATGPRSSALAPGELITEVAIPLVPRSGTAVKRATRTALDLALVISAATLQLDADGRVTEARICIGSVGPRPIRCRDAEAALVGLTASELTDAVLAKVGRLAAETATPITDIRTTAAYRTRVCGVLTARALREALAYSLEEVSA